MGSFLLIRALRQHRDRITYLVEAISLQTPEDIQEAEAEFK